jgi:anthranilate synthase component 2
MSVLVVDNYDSFTYNLVQYLAELGADVVVLRNDEASVARVRALAPHRLVISPGPKAPEDAGHCLALLAEVAPTVPTLGVCLGHQCLGHAYGGRVIRAPRPMHGKVSQITHSGAGVFRGLPSPFSATRYHSLCVEESSLPACLEITARSEDGVIQGLRHRTLPIEGVQFHPESILTDSGKKLLANFLA